MVQSVLNETNGLGVDVALEMVEINSSLNNALKIVRRGGHVVLFGVRNGDMQIEDYHRVVMNGIQLHGVVGRRILILGLSHAITGRQKQWDSRCCFQHYFKQRRRYYCIYRRLGKESFEKTIHDHPKPIIRFFETRVMSKKYLLWMIIYL